MQPRSDAQLLREFAQNGADAAFTELVTRHTNLVYSCALRQVGSPDIAADVAQKVFLGLARGARKLSDKLDRSASLAGWLCRATRNLSLNHRRDEFRRQSRERQAMENLNPPSEIAVDWDRLRTVLDDAMSGLDEPDYDAIVMRFYQNQDLRAVGLGLGVSDDTAQKRVSRALDKLREILQGRGIATGASALSAVLVSNAVQAAPAGLAATISTAALAGATATILTHATMNFITIKSAAAITAAALAAGTGSYLWQQHQINTLRGENTDLAAQRDTLTKERDDAVAAAAAKNAVSDNLSGDKEELLRLRGEVGALRRQSNELSSLRLQNHQLQDALAQTRQNATDVDKIAAEKAAAAETMHNAQQMALGIIMYADSHQNHFPNDVTDITNYFKDPDLVEKFKTQFEMVAQGSMENVTNPPETIVIRARQPVQIQGKWAKIYAFMDGHVEQKGQPPEGFDAWEQAHMMPAPASQ